MGAHRPLCRSLPGSSLFPLSLFIAISRELSSKRFRSTRQQASTNSPRISWVADVPSTPRVTSVPAARRGLNHIAIGASFKAWSSCRCIRRNTSKGADHVPVLFGVAHFSGPPCGTSILQTPPVILRSSFVRQHQQDSFAAEDSEVNSGFSAFQSCSESPLMAFVAVSNRLAALQSWYLFAGRKSSSLQGRL